MDATSLQQISDWCGGRLHSGIASTVSRIVTDSRACLPGDLFVALTGERFDGNEFIGEVAGRGVSAVLAQTGKGQRPQGLSVIEVDDTLVALQKIGAAYRRSLSAKVVGITGSSGKTSTKDFAFAVLSSVFKGWCTSGNLNNHIGVPLTLLSGSASAGIAVVEMGMNHAGEIAPLAAMASPDVAIITNVGTAHIEFLGSREAIAREKGALAAAVGIGGSVVLAAEDEFTPLISEMTCAQVSTAGIGCGQVQALDVQPSEEGSRFRVVYEGQQAEFELAVPGLHMVRNAVLAVAAGLCLGVSLSDAARGLRSMTLTKGRMQLRVFNGIRFLDDTYNANPDSMKAALATLSQWPSAGRRVAVLGRMGELGRFSEEGHREVGRAASSGIDSLITVGSEADWISQEASRLGLEDVCHYNETAEAASALRARWKPGDIVLVKGSRSARMERVIEEVAAV